MRPPFRVVIPARFSSTRLPGKPLADIAGKPMVLRVYERAMQAGAQSVWVATDHPQVEAVLSAAGAKVMMTREDHPSGTDRIAEVAARRGWSDSEIVVNVQGDEPLVDPALIGALAGALAGDPECAIATASHRIEAPAEVFNPNVVKVVCDARGRALYFSRATIPWARDAFAGPAPGVPPELDLQRHVGIYAYRCGFLRQYAGLAVSPLERWEALEQLRALWHGFSIRVLRVAQAPAAGVDTPEDLARVRAAFDRTEQSG